MGVAGLWDLLRPAAKTRSLTELAVTEGFQANPRGLRGYRIGIDASIWFFHAEYGKEGENPVLRTLFFRCATLMRAPFLPLFVFDGPKRPDFKRGKRINKTGNKLIPGMKRIVEAFGFEWRTAPGEAEAELAYLNRIGVIDGILSDDVDNFLFGAVTVIRNLSNNLSGNKANPILNSQGKDDKNHTRIFRSKDIEEHSDVGLTRGGMILIGLMSGGDYHQGGLERCGTVTAHALARCGFGDRLYYAALNLSRSGLVEFMAGWRDELRNELRTNSKGFMARKSLALSKAIPDTFPDIDILLSYVNPVTSESLGHEGANPRITWSKEPNIASLAAACELFFEWGYREAIVKRFRTIIWPGVVLRILRRAVLDADSVPDFPSTPQKKGRKPFDEEEGYGTPSKIIAEHFSLIRLESNDEDNLITEESPISERLIVSISRERMHASTDGLPEYRLEIAPAQLVRMAESGLQGLRSPEGPNEWDSEVVEDNSDEPRGKIKPRIPVEPASHLRLWMPCCMVDPVEKGLVKRFRDAQERKKQKKRIPSKKRDTTVKLISKAKHQQSSPPAISTAELNTQSVEVNSLTRRQPSATIELSKEGNGMSSNDEITPAQLTIPSKSHLETATQGLSLSKHDPEASKQLTSDPTLHQPNLPLLSDDSDDELPDNVYQILPHAGEKKRRVSKKTTNYISLSDTDDNGHEPYLRNTVKIHDKKSDNQTTLAAFIIKERRRDPPSQDENTRQQLHKSPRKNKTQVSPRCNIEKSPTVAHRPLVDADNSKTSHLVLTDSDSDIGYHGARRPAIAPLKLARARVKERAAMQSRKANDSQSKQDIIDLT